MVAPQDVDYNAELFERVLNGLRTSFKEIYPYLSVLSVISLTAKREELEQIRAMKEELYIAELELEQLQLRNDYLNRLQSVEHSNELRMAREDVDFHALMDKIDEERLLNEDKRAEFEQMLKAQALIREARTAVDVEVAINKLKQTALLSEEELQKLKNDVDHRLAMQEASQGHELAMATLQNDVVYEREKLNWNLERQKKEFDAALEEARERAAFGDERREADFDFQKREDQHDLDILKQMQAMREEALKSQHAREMEEKRLESETSIEHHRINATMSFEQIMASNPDISPEAAQALAEKFKAEAASAQNDKTVELTRQHSEDLKAIMEQQMALTRDIVHAQNQANANAVAAKQAELDRVHGDSERNQDRFLSGMQTTITAVADATKPTVAPVTQPTNPKTSETFVFCPNCGKKHGPETLICDACGTSL